MDHLSWSSIQIGPELAYVRVCLHASSPNLDSHILNADVVDALNGEEQIRSCHDRNLFDAEDEGVSAIERDPMNTPSPGAPLRMS